MFSLHADPVHLASACLVCRGVQAIVYVVDASDKDGLEVGAAQGVGAANWGRGSAGACRP